MRLLQQALLQALHRELALHEQRLPHVPPGHQDTRRITHREGDHHLVQDSVLLLPSGGAAVRD